MKRPSVLVFDIGKVFIDYVNVYEDESFLRKFTAKRETVKNFFTATGPFFAFERGDVSDRNFFFAVESELGYRAGFEDFVVDFNDGMRFEIVSEMKDFLFRLKAEYGDEAEPWALSNVNGIHLAYWIRRWPGFFANFRERFFSCEMGARKPEEEIYVRALERGGRKAEDCLFIDDRAENVIAAERLGMDAAIFTGLAPLRNFLRSRGFYVNVPEK